MTHSPDAVVLFNQVPKDYVEYDIYFNLVHNDEQDNEYFEQLPRVGAFEVSYKG